LALVIGSSIGCGSGNSSTPATPIISPIGGSFTTVQTVSISSPSFGTTIYYTTDGSLPTTSSQIYSGPITGPFLVTQSETVKAIAVGASPLEQSPVASATFVLTLPPAPTPTIMPAPGTYSGSQSVTIADSLAGTTLYYTTDGSMPTTSSTVYKGAFVLFANATVNAVAYEIGYAVSAAASAAYTIQAATPAISPAPGTYTAAQTVTITDTTPAAVIHYTTDGSTPTASSPIYNGGIAVSQSETVQAIAVSPNNSNSAVASAAYVIKYPAPTPSISPAGGTYTAAQTVTITDSATGAVIYFTTDGSTPTTASPVYTAPFTVSQTETVQAIALAPGDSNSAVATQAYTLNIPTAPAPTFTPAPAKGTIYSTPQTVTIADSLSGAAIHYTTNGTTPTISSPVYTGAIAVSSNTTISAIATATGYNPSAVVTYSYYISASSTNLSGTVQSGAVPVYNATVNLYAAGTSGYGRGATLLATTTTNASGNFQFTQYANGIPSNGAVWSCPATDPNPDPQIYITAVGGNTQGTGVTSTNNTAAGFIVAVGPCSTVSSLTNVMMNEETTTATVFALAQYINPGSGPGGAMIGTNGANTSSSTPQGAVGLNNAVAGIVNLANVMTGAAVTANTYKGTNPNVANVTVTATPETAKLITIANILGACINSASASGNPCTDLFANATPPPNAAVTSQPAASFVSAQDTIQAAYYMAINPASNGTLTSCTTSSATTKLNCLYNLASTKPTYSSGLTAVPTDWTLSVSYSAYTTGASVVLASGGAAITPYTCANAHYFLYGPQHSAVDAYGNLWFINGIQHTDNVSAISPIGVPLFCASGIDPSSPFASNITIDTAGNIWANYTPASGATTGQIYEVPAPGAAPTATALTAYSTTALGSGTQQTTGIVADGYGNVFYTTNSGGMSIYEIPAGTTASSTTASFLIGSNSSATGTNIYGAADSVGRVYFGSNSTTAPVLEVTPASANISGYTIAGGQVTFTTVNSPGFTAGQTVIVSGLTSADGLLLDRQHLALTAVTANSFSAATTLSATSGAVTDPGIAVIVPTGAVSYSLIDDNVGTSLYGAALDNSNYFYGGGTCCGSAPEEELLKLTVNPAGTAISSASGNYSWSAQNIGGLNGTRSVALDGADNLWFGNEYPSSDGGVAENPSTGVYSLGEVSTAGTGSTATFTALSPAATGLSGSDVCVTGTAAGTGCPVGGGFQKATLGYTTGLSIDPSGNVWAPNFTSPADVGTGTGNGNIVEIIGAAVPVVTPLAVAAANGALATKP
jgi:hypothetical protein